MTNAVLSKWQRLLYQSSEPEANVAAQGRLSTNFSYSVELPAVSAILRGIKTRDTSTQRLLTRDLLLSLFEIVDKLTVSTIVQFVKREQHTLYFLSGSSKTVLAMEQLQEVTALLNLLTLPTLPSSSFVLQL